MRRTAALEFEELPTVTSIVTDPHTAGYEILELNGTRFASLPARMVSGTGLTTGVALDSDQLRRLSDAADVEAASRVAVRLLAARPRSESEMRRALRERGHRDLAIDGAIARLVEGKLLDDEEYARHFARIRGGRGHGRTRIIADLRAKGVDGRLANAAVEEVLEEEGLDPVESARALAVKRLGQLGSLPVHVKRRRVLAFLARRGYQGWDVRDLVDDLVRLH